MTEIIARAGAGNAKVVSLQSAANFNVTLKYDFTDGGTTTA
jgi:hypothetical protein